MNAQFVQQTRPKCENTKQPASPTVKNATDTYIMYVGLSVAFFAVGEADCLYIHTYINLNLITRNTVKHRENYRTCSIIEATEIR